MMQEQKQLKVTEKSNSAMETVSAVAAPPPPPLPPSPSHQRRPRVREVSSRFMSPVVSSVQRRPRQQQLEVDPLSTADENRPMENSETPFPFGSQCKANVGNTTTQRKQRAVKLFKENGGGVGGGRVEQQPPPHPSKSCSGRIGNGFSTPSVRPDTPTITVSSRYRHTHNQRSASMNATAAAKLLQASGMSLGSQSSAKGNVGSPKKDTNSVCGDTSSVCSEDENGSNSGVNCSIQSLPEFRSSISEGDMLPTVSTRSVDEKTGNKGAVRTSGDNLKFPTTPFSRSLNMSLSGSEHFLNHSIRGSEKQVPSILKQYTNSVKVGGLCLPPVPPCPKPGTDTRNGKKGSSHQEDVHCLRLLYNRYLQWRYANARAESSTKAQRRESEKALYSLAMKISELRDSVNRKRIELGFLQRAKTLSKILEAQIPYLDEWSSLEEGYSISLTEMIEALLNASVQLPVGGNVRVDTKEVGEALISAAKVMETVVFHIQRFMSKVEETDISISELARIVGGERALIGECGDLLAKAYKSQVEECSLRSQLIQLHSIGHKAKTTE